jgi:hypothetical protein
MARRDGAQVSICGPPPVAPGPARRAARTRFRREARAAAVIATKDVSDRSIERRGGKVARILDYRLLTGQASRNVLVYLTGDGLVTDQDVVGE